LVRKEKAHELPGIPSYKRILDKRVQLIGQTCPKGWTNVSKGLDKRV